MLGVKYYMASTSKRSTPRSSSPRSREVAVSGPWHVFQVADAPVVEGLRYEPVVWSNVGDRQDDGSSPAVVVVPRPDAMRMSRSPPSGPEVVERAPFHGVPNDLRRIVTQVHTQLDRLRRRSTRCRKVAPRPAPAGQRVEHRHGRRPASPSTSTASVCPVLVKVSYFPNWKAIGRRRARTGSRRT